MSARTFDDVVSALARTDPTRIVLRQLRFDEAREDSVLDAAALEVRVSALAGALERATSPGDRVLILVPPGLDYVVSVLACFRARVAAVTSFPARGRRGMDRLARLVASATPALAIVDEPRATVSELVRTLDVRESAPRGARDACAPDDVAVLQYTSGSTGNPRGVVLRHGRLLEHSRRLARAAGLDASQRIVTWLPPYHDMGLVGGILAPLVAGSEVVLFTPTEFAARPERWVEAIAAHRASFSGAPDFAYAKLASRVSPPRAAALDLSCWRVAFTGAERVRAATLDAFAARFQSSGFREEAFAPCYGMAEATLAISLHVPGAHPPRRVRVDPRAIAIGRVRLDDAGTELVSSGRALEGVQLRVVDAAGDPLPDAVAIGEIRVRSETAADSYFDDPAATEAAFGSSGPGDARGWLRTGDLGFVLDGEVFVAGRAKDTLVVAGRNLAPEDLEETAEGAHADVLSHGACAIAVDDGSVERVVVHVESERRNATDRESIARAVRRALVLEHDLPAVEVVVGRRGSIPRTSSGKPRRGELRAAFTSPSGSRGIAHPIERHASDAMLGTVRAVASRVFLLESIAPDERFLDVGAQSEGLVRLAASLGESLDSLVPLDVVFRAETSRELARDLEERALASRPPRIVPAPVDTRPRLGASQRRMWWLHALDPASSAYHVAFALDLEGALDEAAMTRALDVVSRRHESLRTRFVEAQGNVVPVVDDTPIALERASCHREALEDWLERFANRPFDLAADPPTRAALVRVSDAVACLAFCIHHVAIDGAAIDVLHDELFGAYEAFTRGAASSLDPVPLRYADFVAFEQARTTSGAFDEARAHFERRLRGLPPVLAFPFDRPRPATPDTRGGVHRFAIDRALLDSIGRVASSRGATTYVALHAAFALLLARHAGTNDVAVAVPVANRAAPGSERIVGSLVNTLVLRTTFDERTTFLELLDRVRDECIGALMHQDYPFERLVEALVTDRSATHAPIAQVMFDFQRHPEATRRLDGLATRGRAIARAHAQFDLALGVVDLGDRVEATFEYRACLLDAPSVERLAARFLRLLGSLVDDPFGEVHRAELVTELERAAIRNHLTGPDSETPFRSVVESFDASVRARPVHPAVVSGEDATTYRELAARVDDVARALYHAGARAGDRVAVLLSRTVDLVASLLGVLRLGASYVPLDPSHPSARLALVLEDARPCVLVTDAESASAVPASCACPVLTLGSQVVDSEGLPEVVIQGSDVAYVLFTSGTTGRPKGVRITHAALASFLASMAREPGLSPDDRLLAITTIAFDIAALELFLPLTVGATVVLASRDEVVDARRLRRRLESGSVDVVQATPSTMRALLDVGFSARAPLRLLVGGEALPQAVADALTRHGASLHNLYGPTETTIWSTVARLGHGEPVTLGRPIDGTVLRVVDSHGQRVPFGVDGELWIGGVGVAPGYVDRPELDRERFVVVDDVGGVPIRYYRTGDRVRLRADGALTYHGRTDFQVKVRGHRIELPDVERTIEGCEGVRACAVILDPRTPGAERLVAFCDARTGLDVALVRSHAIAALPPYMVPSRFVLVDALPTTPNGKIDRGALEVPPETGVDSSGEEPSTPSERAIASIFARVLGAEDVRRGTSFFDVGGHSLLAVRVFAAIERELAVRLPLRTLFANPSVRALANEVDSARAEDDGALVRLAPGAEPLVWVHASDDDLRLASALVAREPGRGVCALRPPARPFLDLDALAASYVATITSAAIVDGATLVGVGLGGNVAHAMASQIEARGGVVARVVVVDSVVPSAVHRAASGARAALASERGRALALALLPHRYRELSPPYDRAYLEHDTPRIRAPLHCVGSTRFERLGWRGRAEVRNVASPRSDDGLLAWLEANATCASVAPSEHDR